MKLQIYKMRMVREKIAEYEVNKVNNQNDLYDLICSVTELHNELQEVVILLCFNNRNRLIGFVELNRGSLDRAIFDLKAAARFILLSGAASIAIAHNHPSGSLIFSPEDVEITKKLKSVCGLLDCGFLDHLIITEEGFRSIREVMDL